MSWLTWDEEMSVGVAEIDRQHRMIVDTLNELHQTVDKSCFNGKVADLLDQLSQQLAAHFQYEEVLFDETGYQDCEEHRKEHATMARNALDLALWYKEAPSRAFDYRTLEFLKNWAITHVTVVDMKYAAHFKEKGVR